jgi:sensor domain CHASE-containing protein/HAMP domain-containing protein
MRLWARVAVWRLREGWARLPIGVRFLWLLLGVILGLMTPLLGVGYLFLQQSLEAHQQLVQRQRLEAVVSALERELAALLRQVQDYTVWDDAYTALSQRDTAWIRRNITEWLPKQFHYDFAVVMDSQGTVVERAGGDWEWICQTELFQRAMRGVSSAGLHRRGETIYLLAAVPFVDEACSRPPAGVLVAGRALDATLLRRISQSAGHTGGVGVLLNPPSPRPSPPFTREERGWEWGDSTRSLTWNLLHDITGQPIAWLTVEPPRAEQAWLLDVLCLAKQYLLVFGGALALIASLTMVLLLQSHLRRFSVAIQRLASGDWGARIAYLARDEFGYLARAFNQMAQQLQQAFEAQEQQREELLAQNEELERMHAQLQQAHQELATLNAELLEANRALAQAAVTDGLTGLKNHRAFQEALHSAAQMAERLQQPCR